MIWTMIIYNIILTVRLIKFLETEIKNSGNDINDFSSYKRSLLLYPITTLVILIPCSIKRFLDYVIGKEVPVIDDIFTIIVCLQGFFFSFAYGLNKELYEAVTPTIKMVFCCQKHLIKHRKSNSKSGNSITDSFNYSLGGIGRYTHDSDISIEENLPHISNSVSISNVESNKSTMVKNPSFIKLENKDEKQEHFLKKP